MGNQHQARDVFREAEEIVRPPLGCNELLFGMNAFEGNTRVKEADVPCTL